MGSIVSMVKVGDRVADGVRQAMELAQWRRFISPGADVALKVNLGWDMFMPGAITSPWVVEGIIQTIRDEVGSITVVESDQVLVDVEKALRLSYVDRVCRRYSIPFVNMSKGKFVRVKLEDGRALKEFDVPEILQRTEMITVPVMKTHDKTTITGPIKNQWGCLDKLRHQYHLVIHDALADLNRVVKPRFAVLDGTIGMDGDAPKSGRPRVFDRVLASGDIVALDAVQAQIMGFDPRQIPHIQNCARRGLGEGDLSQIEVVGEDYRQVNFHCAPAGHNFVSQVELTLRKSFLRPLVFNTPLFALTTNGAIVWYYVWYYLGKGRRMRNEMLAHPKYGRQWTEAAWK
jgi:uncharacterized protein (DUF362 family)